MFELGRFGLGRVEVKDDSGHPNRMQRDQDWRQS